MPLENKIVIEAMGVCTVGLHGTENEAVNDAPFVKYFLLKGLF